MTITSSIFDMFARSPLMPLEKHMDKVHSCVEVLIPLFEAVLKQDWNTVEQLQHQISVLEREADQMKKNLRLHLPRGLFLPVPRTDLLEVLFTQDRLANKAKDIAGIIIGRRLIIPDAIAADFIHFLKRCIDASKQARDAINQLDELLETGFRGNEVKLVEGMITTLDAIEHDTDEMQIVIRKKLFEIENTLAPVDVIFLYKIIEWTGDLADRAQAVGGLLELLLAR